MNIIKEFMKIKREQLWIEERNRQYLINIFYELRQIKEMLEVKAVIKKRGGQIWKK